MAKINTAAVPFGALTVHRAVSVASDLFDRFTRWRDVQRTVRILNDLEDDQLEDLGLTRGDIEAFGARGHF